VYYDRYYAPINERVPDMPIARNGLNLRSKHLYSQRHRAVTLRQALAYLQTDSEMELPGPDAEVTDPTPEACPAGIFYEVNVLEWGKVNAGRFANLAQIARDILPLHWGSVGVEQVFSMAKDVIPYRRSQLKSITIQASIHVKSYENAEL